MSQILTTLKYQKQDNQDLEDVYKAYIAVLSKYAVQHLHTDDNSCTPQDNFAFAVHCIKPLHRDVELPTYTRIWEVIRYIFREQGDYNTAVLMSRMVNNFQPHLTKADQLQIFSRAALYCLQFLCDASRRKDEAERHLKVVGLEKKRRNSRPWQWHRQTSAHNIPKNEKRLVFLKDPLGRQRYNSCLSYAELANVRALNFTQIYSCASFDWAKANDKSRLHFDIGWLFYLAYLEYITEILPLAGRYPPLIEFCRTKAFAPMSMMFPALSRRARREIDKYLQRMELEDEPQTNGEVGRYEFKYDIHSNHHIANACAHSQVRTNRQKDD